MQSAILMEKKKCAKSSITEPRAVRQHCLENGFKLARRSRDDAQHLGGCRLLLQCLSSLPSCLGKLPPCLVSVTLCFRKLAGPGFQLLVQSFD
jgi:hypothetical protein